MRNLGPTEIILILLVLVLLFGAKKLPELARGSGRALRIFKAETKGLIDDDDEDTKTPEQRQIDAQASAPRADVRLDQQGVQQPQQRDTQL
jgi:sec-independent protein translocase protein TatA